MGIQSHLLPHAGALTERATRYFGIDLARLPQMSDHDLALFADRATAMTRLKEILPILEKHFTTLIEGQAEYEQFVQRVLKQVEKGSKQIDKSLLDTWLLSKGYDKHLQLLNQKAGHGMERLNAEYRSEQDLNRLDFQSAVKLIHLRHQNRAKAISEKVAPGTASDAGAGGVTATSRKPQRTADLWHRWQAWQRLLEQCEKLLCGVKHV
jgi:hypothetical protein